MSQQALNANNISIDPIYLHDEANSNKKKTPAHQSSSLDLSIDFINEADAEIQVK